MKKRRGGRRKRFIWYMLTFLAVLMLLPYVLPVSAPAATLAEAPFHNSAFETVHGYSFHYRVYRPEEAPVTGKLLLVHGLGGSTFSFEAAAPQIAEQGYLVLSVDLPGFGYSDRNPAYDHSQANRAKDVWTLLSLVDEGLPVGLAVLPWHLAGHSMGGGTVAAMAVQNEARTASLVLIDPALFSNSRGFFAMDIAPVNRWLQVALEHFILTENNIKRYLGSAYGREPSPAEVQGYLAPLRLRGTAQALGQMVRSFKREDPTRIQGLKTPILAIWGQDDTMVPPGDLEKLQAIRPDLTPLLIAGAAHCPMETHVDIFVEATLNWMAAKR